MDPKIPRPAALAGANRAAGQLEVLFRRASKPQDSNFQNPQQRLVAWTHVFVSRHGWIGYWIQQCPICGHEHIHGPYQRFDPRQRSGFAKFQINLSSPRSLGWRGPHCDLALTDPCPENYGHEYELILARSPARFAPGTEHSFCAKSAMKWLRSIGMKTSNEVIPSERPYSWWRWR